MPKPQPSSADLAYCMNLPPKKAIAYLESKGYTMTWNWEELWQEAQSQAFTVAKVTKMDVLQEIRNAAVQAVKDGWTETTFKKNLTPILKEKGWWGVQEHTDDDGVVSKVQLGSPRRLETIYRVNVQTAYMAGRFAEQLENVDDRPYWMYVAVLDSRTRPAHRALNGKVFRYDDPFWSSFYPPNGWRCRCRVVALSADEVKARGLVVEHSSKYLGEVMRPVSANSDEMRPVTTFKTKDPDSMKSLIVSPDVGWSYNPGAAAWHPEQGRYSGDLQKLAGKELK